MLPYPQNVQESLIYDKFLTTFWEIVPKKSIAFCDKVINNSKNTSESPLVIIRRYEQTLEQIFNQQTFTDKEVFISLHNYQIFAMHYRIPVLEEAYTDRYSEHHDWITGVPKANTLTNQQLDMTISQVMILDYIINNVQPKDSKCPYFIKMRDWLMEQLKFYNIKDKLEQLQLSYSSTQNTINQLLKD